MGTDISIHVEIKRVNQWCFLEDLEINRSYRLFATLANVRNDFGIIPIHKEFKGLPKDVTIDIEDSDLEEFGYTGYTWLLLSEMEEYKNTYNINILDELISLIDFHNVPSENIRIVFTFC